MPIFMLSSQSAQLTQNLLHIYPTNTAPDVDSVNISIKAEQLRLRHRQCHCPGVAWKLDQSDVTLIVEHSNNLKFMSNI